MLTHKVHKSAHPHTWLQYGWCCILHSWLAEVLVRVHCLHKVTLNS